MTNVPQTTPDNDWTEIRKILRETSEMYREMFRDTREMYRKIGENQAETDRIIKETGQQQKETARLIKETGQQQKETDRLIKETGRLIKETGREIKETDRIIKETGREIKETDRIIKEAGREIKNVSKTLGAWANNQGRFAEEYFFNSFEKGQQNFFGEKFDRIEGNVKGIKENFRDEYDILLINGKAIGIIEVKYKAHENDVPKVIRKAETFRGNFPEYQNHKVYLGLATLVFNPELEQDCINEGIAVIKQAGDTVIINDKHLKTY